MHIVNIILHLRERHGSCITRVVLVKNHQGESHPEDNFSGIIVIGHILNLAQRMESFDSVPNQFHTADEVGDGVAHG